MYRHFRTLLDGLNLKSRLYAVHVLLGILPVVGALLALLVFAKSRQDHAELQRASRGQVYLERTNALVNSVVMESRGIYMSRDWTAAEPFAKSLLVYLAQLKVASTAWTSDALRSQKSSIEELSKQVDEFVRFRTELVRLAREVSTEAARTFGDNDANRYVRSMLNGHLTSIARAYEQEAAIARSQLANNDWYILSVLTALAVVAGLVLVGGFSVMRAGLLKPLLEIKQSMLELANGQLHHEINGTDRHDEIGEMARAVQIFQNDALDRERVGREARLLAELNEWLQSSKSLAELYDMVAQFLSKLLPGCAGSLYIYANSRDVLESACVWNGGEIRPAIPPDDCWGLRRGRSYVYGGSEVDFRCSHVSSEHEGGYCCLPILAHGETVGLLHLQHITASSVTTGATRAFTEQRKLAAMCAEHISLAIANVKLRDQLHDESVRDALTGLFNRRYLLETCRREFARAKRFAQPVSLLSIDVDHFKKFNDNHGHDAGDTVLRAVSESLQSFFREEDVAGRFGGEEFLVILPAANADVAARRAEELRSKIEQLVVRYVNGALPRITVSIGVASFPECGDTPALVLKSADEALYRAKERGRNAVELAVSGSCSMLLENGRQNLDQPNIQLPTAISQAA